MHLDAFAIDMNDAQRDIHRFRPSLMLFGLGGRLAIADGWRDARVAKGDGL